MLRERSKQRAPYNIHRELGGYIVLNITFLLRLNFRISYILKEERLLFRIFEIVEVRLIDIMINSTLYYTHFYFWILKPMTQKKKLWVTKYAYDIWSMRRFTERIISHPSKWKMIFLKFFWFFFKWHDAWLFYKERFFLYWHFPLKWKKWK